MQVFNKRTFTYEQFCRVTDLAMFSVVKKRRYFKKISKAFQNHIMLAVTEVNGCQACTWFHTKHAARMKLNEEDISSLLSGEIQNLPEEEHVALLFAQHYADTFGVYDLEEFTAVKEYYGEETAEGILASIRMIMLGNVNGIAFGSLKERIKGHPVKGSKLRYEILNLISVIWLPAYYILKNIFRKKTFDPSRRT